MNMHLELNHDRPRVLETTLSATFTPSTNLQGEGAGAAWLFLLPTLPLDRAICLGTPSRATLTALAAFCDTVTVLDAAPHPAQDHAGRAELANVAWGSFSRETLIQQPDASVDLVLLVGRQYTAQAGRIGWLQAELRRLIKPDGWLHYEYAFSSDPLAGMHADAQARCWVTPLWGEMATLAPIHDEGMRHYVVDRAINSPSFRFASILKRGVRERTITAPRRVGVPAGRPSKSRRKTWVAAKSALRSTGSHLVKAIDQMGASIERNALRRQMFQRTSVLLGHHAARLNTQPPHYLCTAARQAGVTIDDCRWGLVAPTDYASRKLIFFLFDRTPADNQPSPRYVVKMVRHPSLNARLENERRSLTLLHESRIRNHNAIPRVVFSGVHAGLALVGESAVEGVPFRSRTRGDADCPYLHQAVEWLADLGSATARRDASNAQVADALDTLLGQFLSFYQMAPEHRAFMSQQIDVIAASSSPLPTVFQHGDPGLWNLLVTPDDQVVFLDWEAAETAGMPLWDFFHLIRSYSVHAGRTRGVRDAMQAIQQQLLADTPLRQVIAESIRCYGDRVQLAEELVPPLFYTCWMHRAIKEASRLPAARLQHGHYVNLLRLCIEQHNTALPIWQRIRQ